MYNQYQQQPQQPQQFGGQQQFNAQPQSTGYGNFYQQQVPTQGQQQQFSGFQTFSNAGALNQQPTGFSQQTQAQPQQPQQQQPQSQPQQGMQQPFGNQQQQMPLTQQLTGFNSMMPQTSFGQPQQQMPMNTSFNQGMSTTAVNAPTGPLQPQQTGFYSQQQPLEPLKPTATGFINSFANTGVDNTLKIPAIRLSFITTQDQAKFEKLFRSVVTPGSNTITGDQCRNILVKSGLQPHQLAKIWTLSDTNKAGVLLFPEFALAMYLVNSVLQGDSIPYELDSRTKAEVSSFVDAINFSVSNDSEVEQKPKTPFDDLTAGISMMQPQPTGYMPQLSFGSQPQQMQQQQQQQQQQPQQQSFQGLTQQPTGGYGAAPQTSFGNTSQALQPQSTGFMPQNSFNQPLNAQTTGGFSSVLNIPPPGSMPQTSFTQQAPMQTSLATGGGFLQPQATGYLPPSNFQATAPLQAQKTGFGNNDLYTSANLASKFIARKEEAITPEEKSLFYKIFETYDVEKTGNLDSATAVEIFRKSGLNRSDLEHIWNLCDTNNSGNLNKQEFALGMHLVYRRLNGEVLPNTLPPSLIPSSTKILNTVKDQLKQGVDKNNRQPTKEDGLRFRNNDDELLPSSRNRRKTIDQSKKVNENKEKIENLKNLIREKKELLASEKLRLENDSQRKQSENADLLRSIENLKSQIQALPSTSKKSPSANNAVPHDLQSRFDTLTARIPNLFKEISDVSKELVSSQLALHHLKVDHPIRGSGPNCKITELDCKNARQRLTLTAGMCTLVGRPEPNYDNLEAQAQHFNEGIETIEKDDQKNQSAINNISTWIQEISSSVQAIIHGRTPSMGLEMDKWESGIGLEPEVRDFIISWKNRRNFDNSSYNTAGYSNGIQISSSATYRNNARAPEEKDSYSSFQTPEERSAYVKEQAKKKMEEKLAALGIKKKSGSSQSSPNPPQLTQQQQPQQQQQQQQQQQTQPLSNVTAFLEDFIAPDVPLSNAVPRRAKLGSFQTKQTTALNPTPDQDTGFRPLEVDVPVPSGVAVEDSQQQVQQQQIQNNSGSGKRKHRTTNGDGSSSKKINRSLPMPDSTSADGHRQSQEPQASHIADEKYYTSRGQSKKRKVYTGNFKFFNSPQSIMDIWKEYTEGFEGQPSIKEMEQMYHVSWRREPAMNKRYHRRRVLCKAIERGLEKGFHLDDVLRMLEDARVIDAERGTKHSISWICQFSHIPEILR